MQHTTTLGVREHVCHRYCMERECISLDTKLGTVHCKHSHGYNIERIKPEYEDLAAIARETGLSLEQVQAVVQRALIKT